MELETDKKLVNFRISDRRLRPFDQACRLSGVTRTQALNEMIINFTSVTAASMPQKLTEERRSVRAIKNAVERLNQKTRPMEPADVGSGLRGRLKRRFSDFLVDDPITGQRS